MSIPEEIRDTIALMPAIKQFIYESPAVTNIKLDKAEFPCAVLLCMTETIINTEFGYQREMADCNLSFLVKADSIDFDGWKNQVKIDAMKQLAMDFYKKLLERNNFSVDGTELHFYSVFNKGDVLTTGVSFQFRAIEKVGKCINSNDEVILEF